jgi:hypothetical protein
MHVYGLAKSVPFCLLSTIVVICHKQYMDIGLNIAKNRKIPTVDGMLTRGMKG